ncbi:ADP-ribosylglycohydrolase family protein [Foetidibacter luteolus]|uniref:ADP-ribosylglycohydrolase family protein n=1 Tax=Foetidibacter luteolus TaxID=2608880 RepID=UPI00129AEADA|nr:ADP-ribosylglycohydrolase family protein [Foetidibacter luteolus]
MRSNISVYDRVRGALFGLAIGDALGVPAEFQTRQFLKSNPIKDLEGYKSHNQPPGTFSDDTSLAFCLAESICNGYNINDVAQRFTWWYREAYWTANGDVFDIGITTSNSIRKLEQGYKPHESGECREGSNGNGSLMRILPLVFYVQNMPAINRYNLVKEVSSITHAHIRSVIACFYYVEFALLLLNEQNKEAALEQAATRVREFLHAQSIENAETDLYSPLFHNEIPVWPEDKIHSSGYVLHTLTAAVWCFMNNNSYRDTVINAVNLGNDSDTTACVAGGLAGLYYGYNAIPQTWVTAIKRTNDIEDLCQRFYQATN